jgi:hypothetical protein
LIAQEKSKDQLSYLKYNLNNEEDLLDEIKNNKKNISNIQFEI